MSFTSALLQYFSHHTRKLFLFDGLGALLTAAMLGFVMPKFEGYFGMPHPILYKLSIIGSVFALYSLLCAIILQYGFRLFLLVIAFANVIYCFITFCIIVQVLDKLTIYDFAYFIGEVGIITLLVSIELNVAKQLKKSFD